MKTYRDLNDITLVRDNISVHNVPNLFDAKGICVFSALKVILHNKYFWSFLANFRDSQYTEQLGTHTIHNIFIIILNYERKLHNQDLRYNVNKKSSSSKKLKSIKQNLRGESTQLNLSSVTEMKSFSIIQARTLGSKNDKQWIQDSLLMLNNRPTNKANFVKQLYNHNWKLHEAHYENRGSSFPLEKQSLLLCQQVIVLQRSLNHLRSSQSV